jgi:hypothetical protein
MVNKRSSAQNFKKLRFHACPQGGDDEEKSCKWLLYSPKEYIFV